MRNSILPQSISHLASPGFRSGGLIILQCELYLSLLTARSMLQVNVHSVFLSASRLAMFAATAALLWATSCAAELHSPDQVVTKLSHHCHGSAPAHRSQHEQRCCSGNHNAQAVLNTTAWSTTSFFVFSGPGHSSISYGLNRLPAAMPSVCTGLRSCILRSCPLRI